MPGIAIVTGASRGLGEAMAVRLAKMGYDLVVTYAKNADMAEGVLEGIRSEYGVKGIAVCADVSKYDDCEKVVAEAHSLGDGIEVLVNNGGIEEQAPFHHKTPEVIARTIQVNLVGTMFMARAVLSTMYANGKGCIVNISSVGGLVPEIFLTDYAASKAGVIGFTRSLAAEAGRKGVRVNSIAPGIFDTDMIRTSPKEAIDYQLGMMKIARLGRPDEIADLMEYIVGAEFLTGQTISLNGGSVMH